MLLKTNPLFFGKALRLSLILVTVGFLFTGCAVVHQRERDFLADPIMQRVPDAMENNLESHNLPRREGSAGGNSGSGGGCGC